MIEAVKMMFTRIMDFKGRSRRSEYWWPALFLVVVYTIFSSVTLVPLSDASGLLAENSAPTASLFMFPLGITGGLVFLACILALLIRRYHDVGLSGWYCLALMVASFIPLLNIVSCIASFVILLRDSNPEPNKWGPSPKYEKVPEAPVQRAPLTPQEERELRANARVQNEARERRKKANEEKIKKIFSELLDTSESSITPSMSLYDCFYNYDSEYEKLSAAIYDEFGLDIKADTLKRCSTVGDILSEIYTAQLY